MYIYILKKITRGVYFGYDCEENIAAYTSIESAIKNTLNHVREFDLDVLHIDKECLFMCNGNITLKSDDVSVSVKVNAQEKIEHYLHGLASDEYAEAGILQVITCINGKEFSMRFYIERLEVK